MINDKKNIIIVGGGLSHIPFIEATKNLEFQTRVFDRDENYHILYHLIKKD